jgi:hypothetical protein
MYLRRRLERLERGGETDEDKEERIRGEALRRVTDEDLELVWAYLKRTEEEEGQPTPEEWAAIERYFRLQEEVRNEFRAQAS